MELDRVKKLSVKEVDVSKLHDISELEINTDIPKAERLKKFVKKYGTESLFFHKDGDVVVKCSYADTAITLNERLMRLLEMK